MKKATPNKRYIVIPDQHLEYVDWPAYRCVLKAIPIIRPTGFINLGDVGEWEHASYWQWKKKARPPIDYQLSLIDKDIKIVNARMDLIDAVLDKCNVREKYLLEGNHDNWLNQLVEENEHLISTSHKYGKGYLFRDAVALEKRGYVFYPVGVRLKIGKLYFYHGHLIKGIDHPRNHLLKWGINIMYGHYHDVQQSSITHVEGEKSAWSIGCLKRMDYAANKFLMRAPTNWGHAFAVVDFWSGGKFSVAPIRIIGGQCVVFGQLIDGNKK